MKVVAERFSLTFRKNILAYTFHGNMKGSLWFECCLSSFYIVKTGCGTRLLLITNYFLRDILLN